jgi:hypothetical protein
LGFLETVLGLYPVRFTFHRSIERAYSQFFSPINTFVKKPDAQFPKMVMSITTMEITSLILEILNSPPRCGMFLKRLVNLHSLPGRLLFEIPFIDL